MTITITELATATGYSALTLREGIKSGVLPIGTASMSEKRRNYLYTLYPDKITEYFGIRFDEEGHIIEKTANIKINELANIVGYSALTIRTGLKKGIFPFGTAFVIGGSERYIYILYPKKIEEYFGLEIDENGIKNPDEAVNIKVTDLALAMGHSAVTLQRGLQKGLFPFGTAMISDDANTKYTYILYPGKVKEYFGVDFKENVEKGSLSIDIRELSRITGHTELTIRLALQLGKFPFGTAIKSENSPDDDAPNWVRVGHTRHIYIYYPKKIEEYFDMKLPESIRKKERATKGTKKVRQQRRKSA